MNRRVISLGAGLAVMAASLLPMSAQAHKSVRLGRFNCYQLSAMQAYPYDFNIKLKSTKRYVLVKKGESFGAGRYVHDGMKLVFKSGYLYRNDWKGTHDVDGTGEHRLEMARKTSEEESSFWCQEP